MNSVAEQAATRPWSESIWVGGAWTPSRHVRPVVAPGLDENLGTAGRAVSDDVNVAVAVAVAAQQEWARVPGHVRSRILRDAGRIVGEASEVFDWWIRRESGSSALKCQFEINGCISDLNDGASIANAPSGVILSAPFEMPTSMARRRPHGVVGIITPWNSPLLLASRVVAPALALGNAVVIKPDEQTPVGGGYLLALAFKAAGLPDGLFQVLPGAAAVGEAIVTHPHIAKVSFTGSTGAGRRVGELAGRLLKPVSLELGGNNAFIVRKDAPVEAAVAAGVYGTFFHQGQICFAPGRHLIHDSIVDEYVDLLAERATSLRVGPTTDPNNHLGPMINATQCGRVARIVEESVAQGAKLRAGGISNGLYFAPTVLAGVRPEHPVFAEEIFGPVAAVTSFHDDAEAIELANRSEYGLATSILTADLSVALRMADAVDTGIVHINDQTVVRGGGAPIGGNRASGNGGRAGRLVNLDEWSTWQWVTHRTEIAQQPF